MLGLSVGEKKKEDTEGPFCWMIPFRVPSVCCVVLCVAAFVLCRLQGLQADQQPQPERLAVPCTNNNDAGRHDDDDRAAKTGICVVECQNEPKKGA